MSLTLRFTLDVEFDSVDTAKAYGVALGWALGNVVSNTLATSEAKAPTVERKRLAVSELTPEERHG